MSSMSTSRYHGACPPAASRRHTCATAAAACPRRRSAGGTYTAAMRTPCGPRAGHGRASPAGCHRAPRDTACDQRRRPSAGCSGSAGLVATASGALIVEEPCGQPGPVGMCGAPQQTRTGRRRRCCDDQDREPGGAHGAAAGCREDVGDVGGTRQAACDVCCCHRAASCRAAARLIADQSAGPWCGR